MAASAISPQIGQAEDGFLPHASLLKIPRQVETPARWDVLLPDSEVVQSPTSTNFDVEAYVQEAGGYLSRYGKKVKNDWLTGAQIIERVSAESSHSTRRFFLSGFVRISLRLGGWRTRSFLEKGIPIGFQVPGQTGLYRELIMVATDLNAGYYGWRDGSLVEMKFRDATLARIPRKLNARLSSIQVLFSKFYRRKAWESALFAARRFTQRYAQLFRRRLDEGRRIWSAFPRR